MAAISQPLLDKRRGTGARFWQFLKRELAPFPGRLSASIRVTIAALIVTTLGEVGRSEALFLALFVLVSLPRDFPRQTWEASLQILVTVWCAVFVGLALDVAVADLRVLRFIALGAMVFLCMILGRGLRQPLVGVLSAVIVSSGLIQWARCVPLPRLNGRDARQRDCLRR
jgi:multidrug resistance protein MdtO